MMLSLSPRWLVYSKPFFDDDPYVLEPGGYPNLKAWGAKDPSICSMHPIRLVSAGGWSEVTGVPGPYPALGMTSKSISRFPAVETRQARLWQVLLWVSGERKQHSKVQKSLFLNENDPETSSGFRGGDWIPHIVPSRHCSLTGLLLLPGLPHRGETWRATGEHRGSAWGGGGDRVAVGPCSPRHVPR